MKNIPAGLLALLCTTCSTLACSAHALAAEPDPAPDGAPPTLSDIIVIGVTPLPGANVPLDKVPAAATTLSADDLARLHSVSILDGMAQRMPGLALSDTQGNALFQDVRYHGFTVSPLQGTPQGIAVYQNGVRLNEAFGDTVNWDLAPEVAIDRLTLATNNPAYGLNALGGAVTLEMKNGFTFQGANAELLGGSNGRIQGSAEFGWQSGAFSLYLAAEAEKDDGWRKQSASDVERFYADAGWRSETAEVHLIAAAARSSLGVVGPTPLEMIQADETAIYTWPQTTKNDSGMLALNGRIDIAPGWALQGNVYGRHFGQKHVDGNDSDFEGCSARSSYGGQLCLEDDAFGTPAGGKTTAFRNQFVITDLAGHTFAFDRDATYGTLDRSATDTTAVGGSLQLTSDRPLMGLGNRFAAGGSIDHSDIRFTATTTLGIINPDLSVSTQGGEADDVPGAGLIIRTLGNLGYAPVWLSGTTDYYGAYVTDTLDLTPALSLTAGLRLNVADIGTRDRGGAAPELNSDNRYTHWNPQAGLTYQLGDGVSVYGGYSQSNRAPTPLELDCADPLRPCLLENSLVADPPLRQVVADTYEAGVRGTQGILSGRLDWTVGLFRTESDNDIVALASSIQGRGYYTNVPGTRRQGVDAGLTFAAERWQVYLNYSFVDATYQFDGVLASPNNPQADDNGTITVHSGDRIPGIPRHQVKLGGDVMVTDAWSVGGAVQYYGSQYLVGDDANQNSQLTPYWTMDLRTSYQILSNIQLIGGVNNLFDRRYASYGTYFDTAGASDILGRSLSDARTLTLGAPRTFYGGVKVSF